MVCLSYLSSLQLGCSRSSYLRLTRLRLNQMYPKNLKFLKIQMILKFLKTQMNLKYPMNLSYQMNQMYLMSLMNQTFHLNQMNLKYPMNLKILMYPMNLSYQMSQMYRLSHVPVPNQYHSICELDRRPYNLIDC